MTGIFKEILDYRTKELITGRNPKFIELTDEQIDDMNEWICGFNDALLFDVFADRVEDGRVTGGMIHGMVWGTSIPFTSILND